MNILVTGGSSGLGKAIVSKLADNLENRIFFTYNKSEENAQEIENHYSNTVALKWSFSDEDSLNELLKQIEKADLDILVNNAFSGKLMDKHFHKTDADDFSTSFKENLIPTINLTQACIKHFRKKRFGKIITILTSALINKPPIGSSIYVANKAYLAQLSKSWAIENIAYNIIANTVSPSFMQTNFTSDIDERIVEDIQNRHPLHKLLTCEEVAAAVEFLTLAPQQINGIDLPINAGTDIK